MTERHVLVAGGAGFIGSHVCDRLVERGDVVTCADDFSSGTRANIAHLLGAEGFELIESNVADAASVAALADGRHFSHVMHLASPASPPEYLRRPIDTLDAGSLATRNLLELTRQAGARFFLASTSEVYGDPIEHPQSERYWGNVNPIGERSVYDEAKRFAEALTMAYHRAHGVDVAIVRIFNTYGPRMQPNDGRVVTNFIRQALMGEPLTVYGDGKQTRSFCYIDDEVAGLLALLDSDVVGPVNIGDPTEFTMIDLAQLVLELTGSGSPIEHRPLPPDDPRQRRPDITLAAQLLGWSPTTGVVDGLRRTIDWFRKHDLILDPADGGDGRR